MVGRKYEKEELQRIVERDKAEFVVVFGRRRVGKTFFVREFLKTINLYQAVHSSGKALHGAFHFQFE
jgi:AAA+ ATPase superfamily predicted ATPase